MIQGIIDALTSTFDGLGTAILQFLKDGFETIFLNAGKTGLSNLGTFVFVKHNDAFISDDNCKPRELLER